MKKFYTIKEAAEQLGVQAGTIYQLKHKGEIEFIEYPGRKAKFIDKKKFDNYITTRQFAKNKTNITSSSNTGVYEVSKNGLHRGVTRKQLRNMPREPHLLEGNFRCGQVGMIVGQAQSRKTFLALQMIYDAILGKKFLNQFQFSKKCNVVYNPGEDFESINTRLLALEQDLTGEEIELIEQNLFIDEVVVQLPNQQNVDEFIEFHSRRNPDIVVIDTFAKASIGAEENSATQMGIVMDNANRIAKSLNCFILLIHHMKKDSNTLRGSAAIEGALDQLYYLNWDVNKNKGNLSVAKMKNDALWNTIALEQTIVNVGHNETSIVLTPLPNEE